MGGKGSGGRRAGSGPKKGQSRRWGRVLALAPGQRVVPPAPAVPGDAEASLVEPPGDLPPAEQTAWRALAPHAVVERTLTISRTPGFRRLCRQWAACEELDQRIAVLGFTSAEADRLVKRLEKWEQRLDASLGNFGLRSFGKPAVAEKPKGAANPFAAAFGS